MSPKRLSHFELHEELGAGGMGVVYRAFDTQLQRTVAVKTLAWMGAADGLRARFLTEARAASALSHPGIVTIYEVGTADGIDYIAMELVAGRTLADILRGGHLAEGRVVGHACQLADALAAAHRVGIVHRDLKPANVVVTADDKLKILDFGLAKRLAPADPAQLAQLATIADAERTADGTVLGTPAYMSPEQARGLPIDARTDLFALGCILYEELTGSRPFAGGDTLEVLTALMRDTPEPPSRRRRGLSPRWDAILARLLARQPEDRFASAEALLAELRLCFAPGRASPAPRQRAWMYAVGAGAALAVVALLALRARSPLTGASPPESEAPAFQFRLFSDFAGSHRQPTLSPDGATVAFVAADAAGVAQIWVRSWAGGDPLQVTRGETNADSPHWASKGDRIVFARQGAGIWEVPPLGGQPTRIVENGGYPALSPAGDRLVYVAGRRLVVAAGDGSDPRPVESLSPSYFGHTARASFSPDGAHLVAYWPRPDRPFGDLWRVELATGAARKLTNLEFFPAGAPVWSGDGRSIVFASDHAGSTTLWRIRAAGGEPRPLTVGAGEDSDPALSADGRRLVYTNTRNSWRLVRRDPTTGEIRVLSEQRRAFMLPHLSPDGRRVAFFARSPRAHHLYLLDIASGSVEQVTHGENVYNVHPRWSSDGASLVYYREAPVHELRRIRVDGQGDELLIADWHWTRENYALPSPDGRTLLYTRREEGTAVETRLHDLASGATRPLPRLLLAASWTEDGSAVYGTSVPDESVELCRLDSDQCTAIGRGFYPRLSRDGRTLYTFLSSPPRIRRRDLTSGSEEDLGEIEGYELMHFAWSLAADGSLIYPVKIPGREELWIGESAVAALDR